MLEKIFEDINCLRAKENIKKYTILGTVFKHENDTGFGAYDYKPTSYGKNLIHSNKPNVNFIKLRTGHLGIRALMDIKKGDVIYANYKLSPDLMQGAEKFEININPVDHNESDLIRRVGEKKTNFQDYVNVLTGRNKPGENFDKGEDVKKKEFWSYYV